MSRSFEKNIESTGEENKGEKIGITSKAKENMERHAKEVEGYLQEGIFEYLPESYRREYKRILEEGFKKLQENPIDSSCKISLVLPAYREEKYIRDTLKSLNDQKGVHPEEFEVLVVVNYPEGKEPILNNYNEKGEVLGQHKDRTAEVVKKFIKEDHVNIKVHVIRQDFPESISGVGIAAKLGMDLSLMRQRKDPWIIGYYGADTEFNENWIRDALKSFDKKDVDAVRGNTEESNDIERNMIVEHEKGIDKLSKREVKEILKLEYERYKYSKKLSELHAELHKEISDKDEKKETRGVAAVTTGIYALIKGIKAYLPEEEKKVTSGEEIRLAQDITEVGGRIYDNDPERMRTRTRTRIEKPRAKGGSYGEGLWTMYRAACHGRGDILNEKGQLMVEAPEKILEENKLRKELKDVFEKKKNFKEAEKLREVMNEENLEIIKKKIDETKNKEMSFREWGKTVPISIINNTREELSKRYPKTEIHKAEKELKKLSKDY